MMQLQQAANSFPSSFAIHRRTAAAAGGRGGVAARSNATAAAQAAASLDQQQQQFADLASLLCASPPLVQLGSTPLGRGLVVTEPVQRGTVLLQTDAWATLLVADEPLRTGGAFAAAVLDDWQALYGALPPQLASYLLSSRGDWFRRLCAWLLWLERHGPPAGPWRTYLQLLPAASELPALMNYTPEERPELQCPQLIALAEQERAGIQGLHDSLFSSSTGELRALDLAPDLSDTLWAACMVNSRCFSDAAGREALSLMAPLADMANHAPEPNAAYRLEPKQQTFSIVSTRALQAGDEVLISYLGPRPTKSTPQLLKDYGMVLPGNPNDTIDFAGPSEQQLLSPSLLLDAAAAAAAAAGGADPDAAACSARRAQAVLRSLQPFVATTAPAGPPQQQSGAAAKTAELVAGLQQQCAQQLQRLPTTIAEDEALLQQQSQQLSARHRAAIAARLEHKRLLALTIDVLQSYVGVSGA